MASPDIQERAERLAAGFRKQAIDLLGVVDETPNPAACVRAISQALLEAHAAGRAEMKEEAAKAVEGFERNRDWVPGSLYDTLRREAATAIRNIT